MISDSGELGYIPIEVHLIDESASNYGSFEKHCGHLPDVQLQEDERIYGSLAFNGRYQGGLGSSNEVERPSLDWFLYLQEDELRLLQTACSFKHAHQSIGGNVILSIRAQIPSDFEERISDKNQDYDYFDYLSFRLPITRLRLSATSALDEENLKAYFMMFEPQF